MESDVLDKIGEVYLRKGDAQQAVTYYEHALALTRQLGDRHREVNVLGHVGIACRYFGELRRAISLYEEQLALARELEDRGVEMRVRWNLGLALRAQGELGRAVELMQSCVEYEHETGHPDEDQDAFLLNTVLQEARTQSHTRMLADVEKDNETLET